MCEFELHIFCSLVIAFFLRYMRKSFTFAILLQNLYITAVILILEFLELWILKGMPPLGKLGLKCLVLS